MLDDDVADAMSPHRKPHSAGSDAHGAGRTAAVPGCSATASRGWASRNRSSRRSPSSAVGAVAMPSNVSDHSQTGPVPGREGGGRRLRRVVKMATRWNVRKSSRLWQNPNYVA